MTFARLPGMRAKGATLLLALFLGGCATEDYRYVPADHRASSMKEAIYNEPKNDPSGSVRIEYVGVEKSPDSIHLKLVASNHSPSGVWRIDSSSFFVAFPDGVKSYVAKAEPTKLQIPSGALLGMDLYFPLPSDIKSESQVPEFDFHWSAQAIGKNVQETTAFDRVRIPKRYASVDPYWDSFYNYSPYSYGPETALGYGWGHPW